MSEQQQPTPDGTSQDPSATQTPTESSTPTSTTTEPQEPSLLNKDEKAETTAPKAPDAYAEFKLPEGVKLDEKTLGEATTLFKELNLPQEGAQKLVDFHTKALSDAAQAPLDAFGNMVKEWGEKSAADPDIGPRMAQVKQNLGKAYDALVEVAGDKGPAMRETIAEFKSVMDLTGAGNHPAFIKVLNALANTIVEGRHVKGSGPSSFGQGDGGRPSIAAALFGQPKS